MARTRRSSYPFTKLQEEIRRNRSLGLGASGSLGFASLFQRIARASIAASALSLAACGASHPSAGTDAGATDSNVPDSVTMVDVATPDSAAPDSSVTPPIPPREGMTCDEGRWRPTQGINATAAYSYIAVYGSTCGGCSPEPPLLDEDGTACADAPAPDLCLESMAEAQAANTPNQIRTTSAGSVNLFDSTTQTDLLGPIDTADEALLVVSLAGFDVQCNDENVSVVEVSGGFEVWASKMTADCAPVIVTGFHFMVATDGTLTELDRREISRTEGVCAGRRAEGFEPGTANCDAEPLAQFFGEIARLEASAVTAFQTLSAELAHHGAPKHLVDACLAAAEDEVRHTEKMGAIALRFGAELQPPELAARPTRDLFSIALENAVEGCVRETFGALVGVHQSLTAQDVEIRREMRTVADDETRHSELSWQIASWIEPRLSEEQRQALSTAKLRAIAELRQEMRLPAETALIEQAGLPTYRAAGQMLDQLASTLWA